MIMTKNIEQQLIDNKILHSFIDGVHRLKYSYVDKNSINCSIWIDTNNVTEKTITKLLKNGLH